MRGYGTLLAFPLHNGFTARKMRQELEDEGLPVLHQGNVLKLPHHYNPERVPERGEVHVERSGEFIIPESSEMLLVTDRPNALVEASHVLLSRRGREKPTYRTTFKVERYDQLNPLQPESSPSLEDGLSRIEKTFRQQELDLRGVEEIARIFSELEIPYVPFGTFDVNGSLSQHFARADGFVVPELRDVVAYDPEHQTATRAEITQAHYTSSGKEYHSILLMNPIGAALRTAPF